MSFRIEEWQVMQAWKNGASIESTSRIHPKWVLTTEPTWNWDDNDYRIANLTTDGMRLDELVEKYPDRVVLKNKIISVGIYSIGERDLDCSTINVVNAMVCHPEAISQIKTNIELKEKKLRPWNMKEFEKHRDEWFVSDGGIKQKVLCFYDGYITPANYDRSISYEQFMAYFKREDGSPCGVLE